MTKLKYRLKLAGILAWALVPVATLICGFIAAEPYVFALGALLLLWQAIDVASDRIVKAIESGSRSITTTIEQPFREKLNDALGMARIRPTGKGDPR